MGDTPLEPGPVKDLGRIEAAKVDKLFEAVKQDKHKQMAGIVATFLGDFNKRDNLTRQDIEDFTKKFSDPQGFINALPLFLHHIEIRNSVQKREEYVLAAETLGKLVYGDMWQDPTTKRAFQIATDKRMAGIVATFLLGDFNKRYNLTCQDIEDFIEQFSNPEAYKNALPLFLLDIEIRNDEEKRKRYVLAAEILGKLVYGDMWQDPTTKRAFQIATDKRMAGIVAGLVLRNLNRNMLTYQDIEDFIEQFSNPEAYINALTPFLRRIKKDYGEDIKNAYVSAAKTLGELVYNVNVLEQYLGQMDGGGMKGEV